MDGRAAFVLNEKHFLYILLFFIDGELGRGDYHFLAHGWASFFLLFSSLIFD